MTTSNNPPKFETHTSVLKVDNETPVLVPVLFGPNSAPNLTGSSFAI